MCRNDLARKFWDSCLHPNNPSLLIIMSFGMLNEILFVLVNIYYISAHFIPYISFTNID